MIVETESWGHKIKVLTKLFTNASNGDPVEGNGEQKDTICAEC